MPDYVSIRQLAEQMGLDTSNARKYILKAGFRFVRIRTAESKNQLTLALPLQDAEAVLELRQEKGFTPTSKPINGEVGYFYVVQLVPELEPRRVKLGFAGEVNTRLQAHKTSAPTAQLITLWPCRRSWEEAAIASLTRIESRLIANEVFECESIERLVERGNMFFGLMPDRIA